MIEITRTGEKSNKPSLIACIYGKGGVGKTTLGASAPSPIFIDAEDGTKGLYARGIDVPVAKVTSWQDIREAWLKIRELEEYRTIVIDPTGAFMGALIEHEKMGGANPGIMNIYKWASVKEKFRAFIWDVKRSGRHVLFIAHEKKDKDEDSLLRTPDVAANMAQELVNLCDVVGHLRVVDGKRILRVQPDAKHEGKDRFGTLGDEIREPDITKIIADIHAHWDDPPFEDPPKKVTKK